VQIKEMTVEDLEQVATLASQLGHPVEKSNSLKIGNHLFNLLNWREEIIGTKTAKVKIKLVIKKENQ
jgi:hypothetical protein